jgi:hypothetical protein
MVALSTAWVFRFDFFLVSKIPVVISVDFCFYYPCRNTNRATVVRNVIYYDGICSNHTVFTYGYGTDYAYSRGNQTVVSNSREYWLFVSSAYRDTRTYVNIISNYGFVVNNCAEAAVCQAYTFTNFCSEADVAAKYYSEEKRIDKSRQEGDSCFVQEQSESVYCQGNCTH